jgi:hypothetical protein
LRRTGAVALHRHDIVTELGAAAPDRQESSPIRTSTMLAEIFLLRIESIARANDTGQATTSSDTRFVPIVAKPATTAKTSDRRG